MTDNKKRQQDSYFWTKPISFNSILLVGLVLHTATLQKFSGLSIFYRHSLVLFTDGTQIVSPWETWPPHKQLCLLFNFAYIHCCITQLQTVKPSFKAVCFVSDFKAQWSFLILCFCHAYPSQKVKNRKRCSDIMRNPNVVVLHWSLYWRVKFSD